ncbi:MAG: hypothetical protein Q7S88_01285 [Candidatus Daviesbacteria bacterium]|nr:hypothetical protein [Candidatus Daviesbacteria bacterium]
MTEVLKSITSQESGKRGGNKVKEKYGADYYAKIGKKGGGVLASRKGKEFYKENGRKAGQIVFEKYGRELYVTMGKISGAKFRDERGSEYFAALGRISGGKRPNADRLLRVKEFFANNPPDSPRGQKLLDTLRPGERKTFEIIFLGGGNFKDVVAATGLAENSARMYSSTSRRKLVEMISQPEESWLSPIMKRRSQVFKMV